MFIRARTKNRARRSTTRLLTLLASSLAAAGCGLVLGLDDFVDGPSSGGGGPSTSSGGGGPSTSTTTGEAPCSDDDRDCVGDVPRQCASGEWIAQRLCSGERPVCSRGHCVECREGERDCSGRTPRQCVDGVWENETPCQAPFPGCRLGTCVAPSCQGAGPGAGTDCGPSPGADCCGTAVIPGGTFDRINAPMYPASVSGFRIDLYEITVGRFRAFVEAGKGTQADPPLRDAGAHPKIRDSGWDPAWNSELTPDTAALKVALRCPGAFWTDFPEQNENHPMTCMTWFEAFAFCIWDGGRLPTEAEWNYAAAGGAEQRLYPWGATIDPSKAAYECYGNGDGGEKCSMEDFLPVGSKSPDGDARWGMADMAGNAGELVLDAYEIGFPTPCNDCARLKANTDRRIFRGGTAWTDDLYVATDAQSAESQRSRNSFVGARCARDLPASVDP